MKTLSELLLHSLCDMYYAEKKLAKELPKMAEKAQSNDLKSAFENHATETDDHIHRLEDIFDILGEPAKAVKCPGIDGILEENHGVIKEVKDDDLLDITLIGGAEKAEHYEIGTYRTMISYAKTLGYDDVVELLNETLEEEENADKKLTKLQRELVTEVL